MRSTCGCLLAIAFVLAGCASSKDLASQHQGIRTLQLEPLFEDSNREPVSKSLLPDKPTLGFRLNAGSLGWTKDSRGVTLAGVFPASDSFTLNLDAWVSVAEARALAPADAGATKGMRVVPAQTRIARIYPSAFVPGTGRVTGRQLGRRSYLRNEDGTDLLLAFFDRPCRVEGAIDPETRASRIDFDVDIPAPGFYLLSLREESPHKYRLVTQEQVHKLEVPTSF
jgi:hypothetical protein